jgi:hypothetical protein
MRAWRDVSRSVADNIREAETELEKFFKSIRKQIQDENVSDSRKKKLLSHIQRVNELVNGERTDILERLVEIYAEEKKIQKLMDSGDFDAAINKISAAKRYLKDMIKKIKQAKLLKDSRIRTLITHFNYRLDILSALCACEKSISEIDKGDIRKADNDLEKAGAAYRKVKTRFSVLGRKLATGEDKMIKRYVQDLNAMKTSVETILHKTRGKVLEVKIKKIAEKRAEAFLNKIADENLPLPSETWRSDPVIMGHFNVVADKFEKEASRMAGATLNEADKAKTRENLADQIEVFLREADRYAESIIEKMTDEMVAQEYPTKIGNLENWNIIFMSLKDKAGAYTRIASDIDKKIKFYIDNVITRGNRLRHSPFIRNKILDLLDEKIRVDIIPIAELIKAPEDFDALTIKQMRGKLKRFRDIKSAIIRGTQDLIVDKLIVRGCPW